MMKWAQGLRGWLLEPRAQNSAFPAVLCGPGKPTPPSQSRQGRLPWQWPLAWGHGGLLQPLERNQDKGVLGVSQSREVSSFLFTESQLPRCSLMASHYQQPIVLCRALLAVCRAPIHGASLREKSRDRILLALKPLSARRAHLSTLSLLGPLRARLSITF